jgi:hypothetical protein
MLYTYISKEIDQEEKLFVDQLLVELELAGLDDLELLEKAVIRIHREQIPNGNLADWKEALAKRFPTLRVSIAHELDCFVSRF